MTSTRYKYEEEHNVYQDFEDVYIEESYTERDCLGEVTINGVTGHADLENKVKTSLMFTIAKDTVKAEKGLVSGWANIAKMPDGSIPLDWQGDVIEPEDLEDAAVQFMKDYRDSGVGHKGNSTGIVVESIVFTKDKQLAMGIPEGVVPEGWFITVQLQNEEVISKVKSGEYRMFSIQGTATRESI